MNPILKSPEQIDPEYKAVLERMCSMLTEVFKSKLIAFYYYGSLARGDMHSKSDIDTVAIVDGEDEAILRKNSEELSAQINVEFRSAKFEVACISNVTASRADWVAIMKSGAVLFSGEDFYSDLPYEKNPAVLIDAAYKKYFITSPGGLLVRLKKFETDYLNKQPISDDFIADTTQYFAKSFLRLGIAVCIKRTGNVALFTHDPLIAKATISEITPELREYCEISEEFRVSATQNNDPSILFKLCQGIKGILDEIEPLMKF